ncbi:MAG: GHKL domain-containing protein [Clostridia bacterium]|nr:GHKL domain-containing protein [Clostridia bacterium]
MSTVIEIVNCAIEVSIYIFFLHQMLSPGKLPLIAKGGIVASVFAVHVVRSFIVQYTYVNYALTILLWGVLTFTLYSSHIIKKISVMCIFLFTLFATDLIARVAVSFIFDIANSTTGVYTGFVRYVGMSIVNVAALTIYAFLAALSKKKTAPVDFKYWLITLLFPLFSFFIIFACDVFFIISQTDNIIHAALLTLVIIILVIFNSLIFEFMGSYSANIQLKGAQALIRQQEENYTNIQIGENELSKLRHDILNHIQTMESMLSSSETESAKKLLEELKNSPQLSKSLIYTNDAAIDAVLNFYAKKAASLGIEFLCKINNMSSAVNMTPLDKSTLLTNALNNAIEACESIDKKFIVVDLYSDKSEFRLKIENPSLPPKKAHGIFTTTKENCKNHGYGIMSMESVLEKYNGSFSISYLDGITTLIAIADN